MNEATAHVLNRYGAAARGAQSAAASVKRVADGLALSPLQSDAAHLARKVAELAALVASRDALHEAAQALGTTVRQREDARAGIWQRADAEV